MKSKWQRACHGSVGLVVLFCLFLSHPAAGGAEAVQRHLTLEDVRMAALTHKVELQNLQTKEELLEVKLAKAQADLKILSSAGKKVKTLQAILIEAGKEQTKQKSSKKKKAIEVPLEVGLRFQIAALHDDLAKAGREVFDKKLSVAAGVEQVYYDVLLANGKLAFWEGCEQEALHQRLLVQKQYQVGAVGAGDVALVMEQYTTSQAEKAKAILQAERQKRILGDWIGTNVTLGYTFADDSPAQKLTWDDLEQVVDFAKGHDMTLYQAEQTQKQADKEYTAVLGNNPNVYLHYEIELKQYIFVNKGQDLSYMFFLQQYHRPQLDTAYMWEGNYLLSWMFFQAEGPREWFQPAGISKELATDRQAALFALYLVRRQADENSKAAMVALNAKVTTAYEAVAAIEMERQATSASLLQTESVLNMLREKQKLTGGDFGALYRSQLQVAELQNQLQDNHLRYAKAASAFNVVSGGYLHSPAFPKPTATAATAAPKTDATWNMSTTAVERRFALRVQLTPVVYDVDSFQLCYDDQSIGEKTAVGVALSVANIAYQPGKDTLWLKFYKKAALRYTAEIPASCYEGILVMRPDNASLSAYETAKQEQATLAVQVKDLQKKYLKAVEAGNNDLVKSLQMERDTAVVAMLGAEDKMKTLRTNAANKAQ